MLSQVQVHPQGLVSSHSNPGVQESGLRGVWRKERLIPTNRVMLRPQLHYSISLWMSHSEGHWHMDVSFQTHRPIARLHRMWHVGGACADKGGGGGGEETT